MPDDKLKSHEELEKRFNDHARHLTELDSMLEAFAAKHGFVPAKNDWHRPCRVLRKGRNPQYAIEIRQEGDWKKIIYRDNLPHTMGVGGHLSDEKKEFAYSMTEEVAYFVLFPTLRTNLENYLNKSLEFIEKWTPDVILSQGGKIKHPMAYYREQGGIKIQMVD